MVLQPLLRVCELTKRFPGLVALDRVDFELGAGEIHAILGENGAGKSTLVKILAGSYAPEGGHIWFRGQTVALKSVHHASQLGIRAVFQELSLVEQMTVEENLFLGKEQSRGGFLLKRRMRERAAQALARVGANVFPSDYVWYLTAGQRHLVEIAKAVMDEPVVLILDEPTAALTSDDARNLFELCKSLKRRGVGIIYITHRLDELYSLADRVTVLRDGRRVVTLPVNGLERSRLITYMTGREFSEIFPVLAPPGHHVRVKVDTLRVPGFLEPVSFEVKEGEILGVAGLEGSGKSELARSLFGVQPGAQGVVYIDGVKIDIKKADPRLMLSRGLVYLPADRRGEGLVLSRPVVENLTLSALAQFVRWGILDKTTERQKACELISRLRAKVGNIFGRIEFVSGGTQQEVMVGKGLAREVKVFVFEELTQGIDVGAKVDLYHFVRDLAARGATVIIVSSDLGEILNLCHRVLVFCRGRLMAELTGSDIREDLVLHHYFGEKMNATEHAVSL